jgi:hypothetical protein
MSLKIQTLISVGIAPLRPMPTGIAEKYQVRKKMFRELRVADFPKPETMFRELRVAEFPKQLNSSEHNNIGVACSVEKHSTGINGLTQYNQHENPLIP